MEKSESIKELAAALSKAQSKMGVAKKTQSNPFFKSSYADLGDVWTAIREPLTTNGLSVCQTIAPNTDEATVETILFHESGEWISSTVKLRPTKADPQGMGSAITYARRYALSAIVGLATEDDDANFASQPGQLAKPADKKYVISEPTAPATEKQLNMMFAVAKKKNIGNERIKARMISMFKKEHTNELTKGEASQLIDYYINSEFTGEPELIPTGTNAPATPKDFGVEGELPY